MYVAAYIDNDGYLQVIGPFESLETATEWAADQEYSFLPLQSPECDVQPLVQHINDKTLITDYTWINP